MNEINKENDIFISGLLNPQSDVRDLIANNINAVNTGLLDRETYKQSKFVQKFFTDNNNVFNNEAFESAYTLAQKNYQDLSAIDTYNKLSEYSKYSEGDIYAPIQSDKLKKQYELKKVRNPLRTSEGITSLFGKSESSKSQRELAQMHKVWDSENQKWLDYTAEDQGFLGIKYLTGSSLVYATWDEDGVHFDKSLGRTVQHKKGEWKTDENGEFYCETIGKRQSYGKEFVAYSDILTKEESWANKIDVFDSDDKQKTVAGILFKNLAKIMPYMIPGVREVWGGMTATIGLATVMPTFGKMLEGIATGDKETDFTRKMSTLENYWNRFGNSHSDQGKQSMINFETMAETVSDIFGQLYQMRAAASLANLYGKQFTKAQEKSYKAFAEKFGAQYNAMKLANPKAFKTEDDLMHLWKDLAEHTPEMKELLARQSKLSKSLSLGYMALTSSADVYQDALQSGYDRRMAGLAGITATAGQYAIMMNNQLGTWFLDATTGYKENVSRNVMKKTLRPYYDKIAQAVDDMNLAKTSPEKISVFAKMYNDIWKNGIKNFWTLIKDGGEEYWKRSIIEGVEEITEEAVMDTTKAMFDGLSLLGIGKNADTARFHVIDNTFSSEGAQRYLMNFIGGVIGGALFEFQGKVAQPWIDAVLLNKSNPEVTYSLVKEIMNGNTQELLDQVDRMTQSDNETFVLENGEVQSASNTIKTRGQIIGDSLKNYIKFVESVAVDNGIKLSDEQVVSKAVRDRMLQPIIEESGVTDIILDDFVKFATELAAIQSKLNTKSEVNVKNDKTDKEAENKKESKKTSEKDDKNQEVNAEDFNSLQKEFNNKKQQIQDFLNGENQEYYLKLALQYLHPIIRNSVLNVDKYTWTQSKYKVNYNSLPDTAASLSKEQVDKEYKEWKNKTNEVEKFREIGVYAYDDMQQKFSQVLLDYALTNYKDIRKVVIDKVLRNENFSWSEIFSDTDQRRKLLKFSEYLSKAGLPGFNLEDKLQLSENFKEDFVKRLINSNKKIIQKGYVALENARKKLLANIPETAYESLGISAETLTENDYENQFIESVLNQIKSIPVEELDKHTIDNILMIANEPFATALTEIIFTNQENLTGAQAKILVDQELVNLGYSPDKDIEFSDDDFQNEAQKYITALTAPRLNEDNPILNISESVLKNYIDTSETIDNEIVRNLKRQVIKDIIKIYPKLAEEFKLIDPAFPLDIDGIKKLETSLVKGLDQNLTIEDCLKNWISEMCKSDSVYMEDQAFQGDVLDSCLNLIQTEIPIAQLYESAIKKQSQKNPLFEALRTIGMQVFDGDDMKLFDLLERESNQMEEVSDITEYIRQGITKESIDNFLIKLDLLDSLAAGMEQSELDPDHIVAYNVQMQRFANKYNEGKNADKYKTISTENIHYIAKDIDLLRNKLQFAKILIETNTETKVKQNVKTKQKFEEYFLDYLISEASKLNIDGVSIVPPIDEIEKKETNEEKLALIESTMHRKVVDAIKNGKSASYILSQLFEQLNVNKFAILHSGLFSNGLNSDWVRPTEYDFFVYLTTILATDTLDFDYNYKSIISKEEFKYLPFFIQEYAAKTMYSFAKDDLGIHDAAVKWLYQSMPTDYNQETSRIFFMNGIAGAGKTKAVMSTVVAMLGENKSLIVGPNSIQAKKLRTSLETQAEWIKNQPTLNLSELMNFFLTEDGVRILNESIKNPDSEFSIIQFLPTESDESSYIYRTTIDEKYIRPIKRSDLPSYIFIDEITHFNQAELIVLDTVAKKYDIKIFGAGDSSQKGAIINGDPVNINDIFAWKCPTMTISVRSSNIHKKDNIDNLQARLRRSEEIFLTEGYNINNPKLENIGHNIELKYHQTSDIFDGDKIVSEITVQDLISIKNAAEKNNGTIMVISDLDANGDIADLNLQTKLKDAGITSYEVYTPDDLHVKAVQGAEADYVIVNNLPQLTNNWHLDLISLYTYLSRSLRGTLLKDNNSLYTNELSINNPAQNYTGDYELPGKDQQIEIKNQRIQELNEILGDYKPTSAQKQNSIEDNSQSETPKTIFSNLSENEQQEVTDLQKQGEESAREKQIAEMEQVNPITWKPNGLFGYGFYTRTGTLILNNRDVHLSIDSHTSLDLDGLFEDTGKRIPKHILRGFIKFKNLIGLYPNSTSQYFKEGMKDKDILKFFLMINPEISTAENEIDKLSEAYDYLIGDEDNSGKLHIDENSYLYAKSYVKSNDASKTTPDYDESAALKDDDIFVGFGRRIYTDDGKINQYITCGSLPKINTLDKWKIDHTAYDEILLKAKPLTDQKKIAIFKMDSDFEPITGLQFRKDAGKFYSISQLQNDLNITFDTWDDISEDYFDKPKIGLIRPDVQTVNGIESFSFLHYIAQIEKSSLSYAERIQQLEKAFVKEENGKKKLLVSGKYYAIAKFTKSNDSKFKRVLILEPSGYSFADALKRQRNLLSEKQTTDSKKQNILEERAHSMSQNSQKLLLTAAFKALGAIDANGLAINSGVKDYVVETVDHLEQISTSTKFREIVDKVRNLIDSWNQDFDMDFISEAMKQTHYFGILLMDRILTLTNTNVKAYKLQQEGESHRASVDVDFDLSQTSYREFGVSFSKIEEEFRDFKFETYQISLQDGDYHSIGLADHFIEMPKYSFTDEMFSNATLLSEAEARLTHKAVDFTNAEETPEEKITPTTDSIATLIKGFDPETQCTYFVPKKSTKGKNAFYKIDRNLTKGELIDRRQHTTNENQTNGFKLRAGDYIQIAGDPTHVYRIKYVDFKKSKLEFDRKDGEDCSHLKYPKRSCPFEGVSAIVGREIPAWYNLDEDTYQSKTWKEKVAEKNKKDKNDSKIVNINNLSKDEVKQLIKNYPFLLLYPVTDSDANVMSPVSEALSILEEDQKLSIGWKALDVGIDENLSDKEKDKKMDEYIDQVYEAIKSFESISDLNGVAIVGLFGTGISKYAASRYSLLSDLSENYIKKYISYTTTPKFNTPDVPSEIENETIPGKLKKITAIDKVVNILKEVNSFEELKDKLNELVSAETIEGLKEYSDKNFIKYLDEDAKYKVLPKMHFIKTLDSLLQEKIVNLIPKYSAAVDQKFQIKTLDGSVRNAKITAFEAFDNNYIYSQEDKNGVWHENNKLNAEDLNIGWGIKYIFDLEPNSNTTLNPNPTSNPTPNLENPIKVFFTELFPGHEEEGIELFDNTIQHLIPEINKSEQEITKAVEQYWKFIMSLDANQNASFEDFKQNVPIIDYESLKIVAEDINYILNNQDVESLTDLFDEEMNHKKDFKC